jgi:glycosyltransferase involved in cell wall biosynthesis
MERVRVMGRGVDATLFHPSRRSAATRHPYGLAESTLVLLYVGRISAEKNLGVLAETAAALPDCRLLIAGDGPERVALEATMPDNVIFTGMLHGDHLAAVYAAADVFVFPSLTETFGQVVQEAMASGLPVVAMRSGGVQDIVRHGLTGLLCQPDDLNAWLVAVRSLVDGRRTRRLMSLRARHYAEEQRWESLFDRLLAYYAEPMGGVSANVAAIRH